MIIIDQWIQTAYLYEIQVKAVYPRDSFVTLTLECRVKRIICKSWTELLATQCAASDQGLHCLLK